MRVGIVGGTFDPIHVAHVYLMEECRDLLALDEVLVIPNGDPPHKNHNITPARHRLAMVRLHLKDFQNLTVSDREVVSQEPSYTYKTLTELREERPQDEFFFIMGADSLISFLNWRMPETILTLATLVCFDRANYRPEEVAQAKAKIEAVGGKVISIDTLELEISSTDIRKRRQEGRPHQAFLHPLVYEYICQKGLYNQGDR